MPEPLWLTPPKPTPTPRPFNQDWVPPTGLDERLGQLDRIACGAHAGTRIRPNWLPPSPPFATQLREPSSLLGPASSEALWRAPARRPGLPRFPNLTLLGVGQFECEHDQQGLLQFQIPVYRHEVFHTALLEAGVAMDPHRGSHPACEFVLLNWFDPGEFLMGPVKNPVRFSLPYLVARTPTVQAVWAYVARNLPQHAQVLEPDPASFKAALRPVEMVTWYDCVEFCARVGLSLLNDAEWEYGCRGGSLSAFCFGQQQKRLDEFAWFNKNADGETHEVATLKPNAFGLYDMHGNVWEWCLDEWSGGNAWDPFSWEPPSIDPDAIIQVQLADENGPFDLLAARERRPDPTAARRNLPSSALTRETTPHHSNLTVAQADSDFAPGG